jgi:meiosis induction protein kinase IME2/SME1
MTVSYDVSRGVSSPLTTNTGQALEDRFEVLKDIGDGSFGSVVLARVRGAGSNVARRGTVVNIVDVWSLKPADKYTDCNQDDEENV